MSGPAEELRDLAALGLLRELRPLDTRAGPSVVREGRKLWNFGANDYLGLTNHPDLVAAFQEGIGRHGIGSAASRLVTGSHAPHTELESDLATAKQTDAALTFSSGYATALGCIPAIVDKHDFILLDKLAHACLVDASRLSGATLRVFPHNDTRKLARLLATIRAGHASARILIVTESVFSMDGDLCPLREITDLAMEHEALLLLDEAHAFGVLGPTGMGLAEELGLQDRITFHMGTFSKAAGLAGGYLATSRDWIQLLINRARSFIYSTAPPPALAHAACASLALIRSREGDARRAALRECIQLLAPGGKTPIVPVILGENDRALAAAAALDDAGFLVPAIRYPTVPRRTARLRISLSADHPTDVVASLRGVIASLP